MRALLVGAGGMGKAWARNLEASPKARLVGWVDLLPGAAESAAKELDIELEHAGTDLDLAIDRVRPAFVVDVTSPAAHCEIVIRALQAGLPVIGEKPMATTMEEARRMIAASEGASRLYMISQSRRYDGGLVAYRKLIRERIGQPELLNVDFYVGARFGGFRAEMDSPLLLDMAIHTFDQARFLTGADPISVYAEEFNPSWSWYKGAGCANCLFEMSNGLRFCYRGSWCCEGLGTSWEGEWRTVGEKGTAKWIDSGDPFSESFDEAAEGFIREGHRESYGPEQVAGGISGSLAEFLDCLETGTTPQAECHDNVKSLAMVLGAIESSKTGKKVSINWSAE